MPHVSRPALLFALLACLVQVASARAEPVASAFRAAILLRSLGYERGVSEGQGDLVLVVVSGPDAASQADGREMTGAFQALASRMKIGERSVRVRSLAHQTSPATAAELQTLRPSAVYLARGLESVSAELTVGADVGHWVPMCADGAALGKGCAIGVRVLGDSSQIVIDLRRALRASLSFDPRMLRLAQVLK